MYRLICSDIDGTLIRDDFTISDYTRKRIREAAELGVHFVLTTGRLFGSAKVYAKQLGLNTPILACNGAIAKESATGKVLFSQPIPVDACREAFRLIRKNGLYYHFYGEEVFYCEKIEAEASDFMKFSKRQASEDQFPIRELANPEDILGKDPIYKILFHASGITERTRLSGLFGQIDKTYLTSSWVNNFEICGPGVSKGNAVKKYAESLKIPREQVLCIGDNSNDISMLEYAGMGVAVANALDEVKASADFVSGSNNEDGVGKVIERFVLNSDGNK